MKLRGPHEHTGDAAITKSSICAGIGQSGGNGVAEPDQAAAEPEERTYFRRRAEAEFELARRTGKPAASKAHFELAQLYLSRLHENAE